MANYNFNFRGRNEYCAGDTAEQAFKNFTTDYNCDPDFYGIDETKTRLLQYDADTRGGKWAQLQITHYFLDEDGEEDEEGNLPKLYKTENIIVENNED